MFDSIVAIGSAMIASQEYRKVGERALDQLALIVSSDGCSYTWQPMPELPDPDPTKTRFTKCPSCGSREFRDHNMVRICSYCRSEA